MRSTEFGIIPLAEESLEVLVMGSVKDDFSKQDDEGDEIVSGHAFSAIDDGMDQLRVTCSQQGILYLAYGVV